MQRPAAERDAFLRQACGGDADLLREVQTLVANHRDLLLNANPLEDVKNTSKLAGVMTNGRWLTADELNQQLGALRASYQH